MATMKRGGTDPDGCDWCDGSLLERIRTPLATSRDDFVNDLGRP